jgi:uncharacterized phosphosugar-binding protein
MANDAEHTWGHTLPFGEEYYRGITELLRQTGDDAEMLAEVAALAVEALRRGNKVYTEAAVGHMPPLEMDDEREGNPAQIHCCGHNCTEEDYAALQPGDVLFTNHVNSTLRQLRDAGVYVVGFTTCYINHSKTPEGEVHPNHNGWLAEDVSSRVIHPHIPWNQGIVQVPQVPEMPVFPASSNITCSIHWMLTAEVAHALATDQVPTGGVGRQYIDILLQRLGDIQAHDFDKMSACAVTIARRIISGGRFYVRSGNSGVQGDANGVAQGLRMTNAFEPRPASEGGDKDVFVIAAVRAGDPQELAWAQQARSNGNYLIGIGPSPNDALSQHCDVYFDNRCAEPAGVIAIPAMAESVCPASGILNNIILQMLTAQFVDEMCRRGAVPYFWMGGYRMLGSAYNETGQAFMKERGF